MIAGTILAYSTASNQPPPLLSARLARTSGVALRMGISRCLLLIFAVCAIGGARAAALPEKSFELAIVKGSVPEPQRLLKVEKGDALRLRISSDAPGELHL